MLIRSWFWYLNGWRFASCSWERFLGITDVAYDVHKILFCQEEKARMVVGCCSSNNLVNYK